MNENKILVSRYGYTFYIEDIEALITACREQGMERGDIVREIMNEIKCSGMAAGDILDSILVFNLICKNILHV